MGILDWSTALSDGNRRDLVDGTVIPARSVTRCTFDWDISLSWARNYGDAVTGGSNRSVNSRAGHG